MTFFYTIFVEVFICWNSKHLASAFFGEVKVQRKIHIGTVGECNLNGEFRGITICGLLVLICLQVQ